MPTKRMWLGHAPDVPQIDQVEFDETAATVVAEGTDLIFEVNGKELLVENPHPLEDDDTTQAGDTSAVLTLLQLAEAAINGSTIPEIAELEAEVESPDTDPESPYHRLFVTTREQFHGWPFSLTVKAPNPTIDIDVVQQGAPGQNEKQSYYITPTPSGGSHKIRWNLGSGLETSGTIPAGADADDVKAAMIAGMPTITEDNVIVTGSNTQANPFLIELTDDLAETQFPKLSVDVSLLTGNGQVTISTIQEGGESTGGGTTVVEDTFTDTNGTNLNAHTPDTGTGWSMLAGTAADVQIQNNKAELQGGAAVHVEITDASALPADFEMTCDVMRDADTFSIGFVFRWTSTGEYYRAELANDGKLHILRSAGGLTGYIADGTVVHTAGTTYTFTLNCNGNDITFSSPLDSISVSSSPNATATRHGIFGSALNANGAGTWDNFKIEDVAVADEKWSIHTNGAGGTFTLTKPGGGTTSGLSPASTTTQIKTALEGIYGGTFAVTGGGIPADPWITTAGGTLAGTDQLEPTGNGTNLTGGFDANVVEVQDGSPPLDSIWDIIIHNTTSGNFHFGFRGRPTVDIAYGATAATVLAALEGFSPGDFSGLWTVVDTGIGTADYRITATGRLAGEPQTLKAFNEDLVGTALGITHTTIQQPTGRNWIDNPVNYRDVATGLSGLPQSGDELFVQIGGESHSLRFGSLAGVKLKRFILGSLFSGHIGLPEINPGGYAEYRPTHITLEFEAGTQSFDNPNVLIGVEQGQGSGLVRLKTPASDEVHIRIERTGGPAEDSRPSFCWDGQNVNSTLNLIEGFAGVAVFGFDDADLYHATQRGGLLRFGEGTDIGAGGFDRTGGETFGRASIGGAAVVFGG